MPNIRNYRECAYAETWLEDGITVQKYKKGLRVTLEIAEILVSERIAVAEGVTRPGLADIRGLYWTTDSKAMKFLNSKEATHLVSAAGIYVSNFAQRMALRFFVSITKESPFPVKIFDTREAAMEWLKQFGTDRMN